MSGHDKLVNALRAKPDSMLQAKMLHHVRAFEYHDFKSEKPFPKMQLVHDLNLLGYTDLAELAMNGEYDDKLGE